MQSAVANVVDFDAYRARRVRQQELAGAALSAFPVAWVMVWFAPVVLIHPLAFAGVR
jgi:hypothetical protein